MSYNGIGIFRRNLDRLMETPAFLQADERGRIELVSRMINSRYAHRPLPHVAGTETFTNKILETHWPLPKCDHCGRVRMSDANCEGCGAPPVAAAPPGLPHWPAVGPLPYIPQPGPSQKASSSPDARLLWALSIFLAMAMATLGLLIARDMLL